MRRVIAPALLVSVLCVAAGAIAHPTVASTPRRTAPATAAGSTASPSSRPTGLASPREKEIAMELVSSAENSTLDWRSAYGYIEDIGDGRGHTAGLIGFCSGTGDMLALVRSYVAAEPDDPLARFVPALRRVNGSASHAGLGRPFVAAWRRAPTTRSSAVCRCASSTASTSTRPSAGPRPTGSAPSASSSITTRS